MKLFQRRAMRFLFAVGLVTFGALAEQIRQREHIPDAPLPREDTRVNFETLTEHFETASNIITETIPFIPSMRHTHLKTLRQSG